jgi:hypothetical protein
MWYDPVTSYILTLTRCVLTDQIQSMNYHTTINRHNYGSVWKLIPCLRIGHGFMVWTSIRGWTSIWILQIYIEYHTMKDISCRFDKISQHLSFFKFLNRRLFMAVSHLSNRRPMMSLTYALTIALTNKSVIDLRIWKGRLFENTLKSAPDLR